MMKKVSEIEVGMQNSGLATSLANSSFPDMRKCEAFSNGL